MTEKKFGFESTTDEVLEGIDLTGKVVLITGGNSGLGAETARAMAAKGADVTITARKRSKAADVVSQIEATTGKTVRVGELELGSLASVRAFAGEFLASHQKLNILVNNAGVMACPHGHTEDGFEMQFGTNHIGHFLLTCLLVPALIRGAPSRVVNLSSLAHKGARVNFDDVNFEQRDYDKWVSYGQSKTANVLFSVGLEKRLADHGVHAYAVHPGVIRTNLTRHMEVEELKAISRGSENIVKTVANGAATSVYAATSPALGDEGGLYLSDSQVCPVDDESKSHNVVRSYAVDPDTADRLWDLSETMVGEKFSFK